MSGSSVLPWLSRIAAAAAVAAAVAATAEGPAAPDTAARARRGGAARGGAESRGGEGEGPRPGWRPGTRSSGGSAARGPGRAEVAAPGTGRAVSAKLCVEPGPGGGRRR